MKFLKKKFTLIEILVVVAIIGILVSFLVPVLGNARDKSRSSVCKSNLKQIGTTMYMYLDDAKRIIRHANFPNPGPWSTRQNFPGDTSVLECPSDPNPNPEQWNPSYGFNYSNLSERKLSKVNNPAQTLFFADSGHGNTTHPWHNRVPLGYLINNKSTWAAPIGIRHNYAPNLLWVDGHVSSLNKDVITIHLSDEFWDLE
ncbi:hypothetical protein LNTAR_07484 [Lentisphaera araneosa HTCC2155]|uniref:General secretion pathway protein G n=1 Tax=Lentisphaera araneosa HTCC2155 TaxID=313628 RepID=A6DN32_9BACT|nr:prepilin-type N-terminal cleavage/methylation domain-containing protein [Lentisphaera araneosa]EDM27068.1 hypothetical protein LNTAR_07484 [Lentisphaera araneosa HTCC2155]